MAKFTLEEKLLATLRYLNGNESFYEIANVVGTYNVTILKWVKKYEHHGAEAFVKQYTNYSAPFKLDVLKFMIKNGTTLNETTAISGIATLSTVLQW